MLRLLSWVDHMVVPSYMDPSQSAASVLLVEKVEKVEKVLSKVVLPNTHQSYCHVTTD